MAAEAGKNATVEDKPKTLRQLASSIQAIGDLWHPYPKSGYEKVVVLKSYNGISLQQGALCGKESQNTHFLVA